MDAVHAALRRLRDWFLVWFVFEAAVGTAVAAYVLDGMSRHSLLRYATGGVGATGTVMAGIVVSALLLFVAWLVLEALLGLQPWARMVVLGIGWIMIVSATFNLFMLPASGELLESVVELAGGDWPLLMAVNLLTKLADLGYWAWAVYVLQTNAAVREAFLCSAPLRAR